MTYDAEAEAQRHAQHVDPAWLAPILRAAYAAGECAGAQRMRKRAVAECLAPHRWQTTVSERESLAASIGAIPLDGGDDA